jgi:glycerol uptake facilitator protein
MRESWLGKYIGEAIGVYLIVLFGCGLLFSAILFGVIGDFYSAGMGWGLAVAIAVYAAASMSGAHFNPAVTLGLAVTKRFPWSHVIQYWIAQIIGGFLGACTLLAFFGDALGAFAAKNGLVIGQAGSDKLAMMLIPISPHPWVVGNDAAAYAAVPIWRGFLAEALCTAILMAFILVLLERRSVNGPTSWFFPFALGLLVCMIVIIDGPLTMTSLNPARDLGPRILCLLMGFGSIAFPGVRDGGSLLVTAGAPFVGGVVGALFFDHVMKPFFPPVQEEFMPAMEETLPAPAVASAPASATYK